MKARTAVLELLKGSREWRCFFKACCEMSSFRLRSQVWQFRKELAERGHNFSKANSEVEDALLDLARELLPNSPAAQWDEEFAHGLMKDALARIAEYCVGLSAKEVEVLDLSGYEVWEEQMHAAGLANDPVAFRAALKGWERAAMEALEVLRVKEGGVA